MWFLVTIAFGLHKIYSNGKCLNSFVINTKYYSGNTKVRKFMGLHRLVNLMCFYSIWHISLSFISNATHSNINNSWQNLEFGNLDLCKRNSLSVKLCRFCMSRDKPDRWSMVLYRSPEIQFHCGWTWMWDLIVSVPDHCLSFYFGQTSENDLEPRYMYIPMYSIGLLYIHIFIS